MVVGEERRQGRGCVYGGGGEQCSLQNQLSTIIAYWEEAKEKGKAYRLFGHPGLGEKWSDRPAQRVWLVTVAAVFHRTFNSQA